MPDRPNVLILMSDHTNRQALAPDSQCLTPNFDALAREGLRFAGCYSTNAICSPARASLMTGTYPSSHGMWDCTHTQRREWVNVSDRLTYWSRRFAQAGYHTGYFGKWHVEQTKRLENFGWGEHDHTLGHMKSEIADGSELTIEREGYRDYLMAAVDERENFTHAAFDKGIDFIRRHAGDERPFCCFVSTGEPHDPYIPPRRFMEMYDVDSIEVSPTLREEYAGEKPELLQRMRSVWEDMTDADWQFTSAAYWATITWLDSESGRIIDVLKDEGAYEDTIIIVTADHGDMLGGHGLATKGIGTAYEEVYNIPLIVKAPGMRGGEDATHKTSLVDIGPTLLDLCDLDPMEDCHGRSLRPVLDGTADSHEWQDAYAEFFGQRFVYTQRIVWHGDWKYIFSPGGIDELYNLAEDPHEEHNLAGRPEYQDRVVDMCKRMWRKMKEIGDESLFNTHYATLRTAPVGPHAIQNETE